MQYSSLPLLLLLPVFVISQTTASPVASRTLIPKVTTVYYQLGNTVIPIKSYQYGNSRDLFFINLHDDEMTAVNGAIRLLETNGGTLLRLANKKQRNISFKMDGVSYLFDPNRIFSRHGISQSLSAFGRVSKKAMDEVEKFARRILKFLPSSPTCVIALHNNSDGKFSVTSYLKGNEREKDARAVHLSPNEDPDDLFLTTDSTLYRNLAKEKFNVVWQDNRNAYKDGSLSVYCGEKNIRYLNCETEHGKTSQYRDMILAANKYLRKEPAAFSTPGSPPLVYYFQLSPIADTLQPVEGEIIYFGDRKIGTIRKKPSGQVAGQMEISNNFPLYDNMDFFYFSSRNNDPHKMELRIDPTRSRKIYDPAKAVVPVKIMR
jgi:hypothetical protein